MRGEPTHPKLTLEVLGSLAKQGHHLDEALRLDRRSVEVFAAAEGPDGSELSIALNNLGITLLLLRRWDEAVGVLQRALAIKERSHGPDNGDSDDSANTLLVLSKALLAAGRPGAKALAERVLRIPRLTPVHLGEAKFRLACALYPTERARALALARQAAELVPSDYDLAPEIKAWLASR